MKELSRTRFEALAGYTRIPSILVVVTEIEWHASNDETLLGIVTLDRIDHDFGWVILGPDERLRYRAVDVNASLESREAARAQLLEQMEIHLASPAESHYQGDTDGPPVDFFRPVVPNERLNPLFRVLTEEERYSPARGVIGAMMRFYEDTDGNFIEQFQTTAFDARIWELYLYAAFTELGYASANDKAVPDFIFAGLSGALAIEATSANPSNNGKAYMPTDKAEAGAYLENYIPIKLAQVLRRKLEKKEPYWNLPAVRDIPFVIAVQDFHAPATMMTITHAMTEYAFGVRHSLESGKINIEWIKEHVWGNRREPSGFFKLPNSENVSAILINPQGTLPKFNRLGFLAGFGSRKVKIVRSGLARGELNPNNPTPIRFRQTVGDPGYTESWIEGAVVLHNPHARVPLPPQMVPGAAHEFLQEDGRIMSMLPQFHPYLAHSEVTLSDERGSEETSG